MSKKQLLAIEGILFVTCIVMTIRTGNLLAGFFTLIFLWMVAQDIEQYPRPKERKDMGFKNYEEES